MMAPGDRLWTMTELAEYLGLARPTVRTLCSRFPERLPPRVPDLGLPRWNPDTVRAWAGRVPEDVKRRGRPRRYG